MKRWTLLAAAAGLLLSLDAAAQAPIKIGFAGELSGPQGALGQDMYDAFMLVVERNGGKLGGVPVEIIKKDTQLKPEVAVQVADELIEKDKVPIIAGVTFSNVMMAMSIKGSSTMVLFCGSILAATGTPACFITTKAVGVEDKRKAEMGRQQSHH